MKNIDPNAFYSGEELGEILYGKVSINTPRRYGLKGLGEGQGA